MKNLFNFIYYMIEDYEKYNNEKPYVILVSPKTYVNIRKELEKTNALKYLTKLRNDEEKINYIFGVLIEISHHIIQEAVCMNEREYKKYCNYRFKKLKENKYE